MSRPICFGGCRENHLGCRCVGLPGHEAPAGRGGVQARRAGAGLDYLALGQGAARAARGDDLPRREAVRDV